MRVPTNRYSSILRKLLIKYHPTQTPSIYMNMNMNMNLLGYTYKIFNSGYNTEMGNKQCNAGDPLETPGAKFFYVKGSHRPRPLTRLRRSLIDKTPPITLIRTRRMRIDEFVCIMAVGDRWRSLLLVSVKPQGRNKMCIGLTMYPIL